VVDGSSTIDLHDAGVDHRTGDGDEHCARFLVRPTGEEEFGALTGDEGDVRKGLGIVHEDSGPSDAQRNALVRPEYRQRSSVGDPVRQCRFLAGDEPVRRPYDRFWDLSELADAPLVNSVLHQGGDDVASGRYAHQNPGRSCRRAKDLGTIEHKMGGSRQKNLVFVAGWLTFHAIDDDHTATLAGHGTGQLDGRWKPGTAASQ
jgi:hypothetical protein